MILHNKKNILLVEDEAIIGLMEKKELESYGYSVQHITSGEEAVKAALKPDSPCCLILMDIDLGSSFDGTLAAEQILKKKDIPIVFLSSHTDPEIVEKTEKITSYGYIVKNSGITVLDASIKMAFRLYEEKVKRKEKQKELEVINDKLNIAYNDIVATNEELESTNEELAAANEELMQANNQLIEARKEILEKEKLLNNKIDLILNPQMDISGIDLDKIIDSKEIQLILDNFCALTGLVTAFLDLQGNILVATGWQKICTDFFRVNKTTAAYCTESDLYLAKKLKPGEFVDYKCKNGLWDVVTPLYIGEKHMGNIFTGQFFYEDDIIDEEHFARQADLFGFDKAAFMKALHEVPFYSKETINNLMLFLVNFFKLVSRLSYSNILLAKESADKTNSEKALKESEYFFSQIFEQSLTSTSLYDPDGIMVKVNPEFCKMFGVDGKIITDGRFNIFKDQASKDTGALPLLKEIFDYRKRKKWTTNFDIDLAAKSTGVPTLRKGKIYIESYGYPVVDDKNQLKYVVLQHYDITERKQAEDIVKQQLAEKENMLKEVHHRIKNNINSISSLLKIQLNSDANSEPEDMLREAIARMESMRLLYNKLLLTDDYREVSSRSYFEDLIAAIINIFPNVHNIIVKKEIVDLNISLKLLIPLGSILNELVTNSLKYAFEDKKTGKIDIVLARDKNEMSLLVRDNGTGLPRGFNVDKSNGFGLQLVKMFTQQLNGIFTIKNVKGTKCLVVFEM